MGGERPREPCRLDCQWAGDQRSGKGNRLHATLTHLHVEITVIPLTDPGVRYSRTGLFGKARIASERDIHALPAIPRRAVGMYIAIILYCIMFPLWATPSRHSLPHVIGSPVSEYYEVV